MNGIFLAKVGKFMKEGYETDKNGAQNVILEVVAGKAPSRRIISGTIAENSGFEVGKTLLVNFTEREPHPEHGRQFSFSVLGQATLMEVLSCTKELGKAEIVDVTGKVPVASGVVDGEHVEGAE